LFNTSTPPSFPPTSSDFITIARFLRYIRSIRASRNSAPTGVRNVRIPLFLGGRGSVALPWLSSADVFAWA
jgi:hypothetical protein